MGLLDLPASVLSWTDAKLAALLSAMVCLVAWGSIGALLSMGLYWLMSPQQRIAGIAAEERRLKNNLKNETMEMSDGLASAWRLLRLALTRLGLVLLPVLVAAVPVLSLMAWLQTHYGYDLPPLGQSATVKVDPSTIQGRWIADHGAPRVDVIDQSGVALHSLSISAPVPIVHKRVWWNALIGNPLGYLPNDSPAERIEIGLPAKRYLSVGPDWVRGWEVPFIVTLLAVSVLLRSLFHIR